MGLAYVLDDPHIMGAVIAFGPMYSQPLIGLMGRRNPQHAVLAAEISEVIASRVTFPAAITLLFTGWGLIVSEHIGFLDNTWLWVSVLLYAIALVFGFALQGPNARRMLRLLRSRPAMPAGQQGPPLMPAGQQGPPPEMAALARRLTLGLVFLTLIVTAIFVLMIWQPGGVAHQ